jgi:hypothetical protein
MMRMARGGALAASCAFASLLVLAGPALAEREYAPAGTFGEPCSGEPCGKGQFKEPTGVAVNSSSEPVAGGDVYVIDTGNARIERFSASGTYLGQFNGAGSYEAEGKALTGPATPANGFSFSAASDSQGIAVDSSTEPGDPSAGDVYVIDAGHKVIDKFSSLGKYEGQITGPCAHRFERCGPSEAIPFKGELTGVATESSGSVYIDQQGIVYLFGSNGVYFRDSETKRRDRPGFGLDDNQHLYAVVDNFEVVEFGGFFDESIGELFEFGGGEPPERTSLAVDLANVEVLVDEGPVIDRFDPVTESHPVRAQRFGELNESHGLAVNSASPAREVYATQRASNNAAIFKGVVFPASATEPASGVTETTATLHGTLTLEGQPATACSFEYGTTEAYGHSLSCEQTPAEINTLSKGGSAPVQVSADTASLQPGTTYDFRLTSANANGARSSANATFTTTGRPTVEDEEVASVGPREATLTALVVPNGAPTGYRVQYGIGSSEEFSTPEVSAGTGRTPVRATVTLSSLQPGATYRARFVASNRLGTAVGPELAVLTAPAPCPNATFPGFTPTLPDCRAYELVSNPTDETYVPSYGQSTGQSTGEFVGAQATYRGALNGESVTYSGGEAASGTEGNGVTGDGGGNQYLATRGPGGWEARDISPPVFTQYEAFSADLSAQLFSAQGLERLPASPEELPGCIAPERETLYSRTATGLHSLVTSNRAGSPPKCSAQPAGISTDDSHTLLESHGAYTAEAVEGLEEFEHNLYDSVDGTLYQVNILPGGQPEQHPYATFGTRVGDGVQTADHLGAVSSDGSRVFWTALEGGRFQPQPKALYVRENDTRPQSPVSEGKCTVPGDACTTQVDTTQGGTGASGGGYFWAATPDGSKVFFTDCSRLTSDATARPEGPCAATNEASLEDPLFAGNDLYEYDLTKPSGQRLTDLTVDHNGSDAFGANVQAVIGVGEDGSYVYFVAKGVLAGANVEGKKPTSGKPNLYLLRGGTTSFIATLASTDKNIRQPGGGLPVGDLRSTPGQRTAEVTPGGVALAFQSTLPLTGYDNVQEPDHTRLPELFVYQAGSGRLSCASCNPTGAPPLPESKAEGETLNDRGTVVPTSDSATFMPRWVVDREGVQVYFMTAQPLVPTDHSGLQDVYEWQSSGFGECRQTAGCIKLISSADPLTSAYLVDASPTGRDVFFTSRSQLTPHATGETLKVYDARAGGGRAEPSLACTGTGCQGVPAPPPIFATPSSVTFNGVGNFEPTVPALTQPPKRKAAACKRGFRRRHNRCVRSRTKKRAKHPAPRHGRGRHHA